MLEHVITRHGYLLLFGGVMVEGDAFLLGAAVLANRGQLQLPFVLLVAAAGTMVADQFYYQLARARGRAMLAAKAAAQPGIERVRRWVERRAVLLLFLSRFIYGFRTAIPMACGALGMPAARFTAVNLLGSGFWALSFGLAGYAFGSAVDIGLANVRNGERAVLILLLAFVPIGLALKRRGWPQRLSAVGHPARDAIRKGRRVFLSADRHGRMVLARPHIRLAAFVVGIGLLNVATAVFHWQFAIISVLDSWLPIEAAHVSRAALLVAGAALVAVGRGLARRKRVAWAIACLATLASVPLHLAHHASLLGAGLSACLLWDLATHAHRFTARSDPARLKTAVVSAPALGAAVFLYGVAGYQRLKLAPGAAAAVRMTWDAMRLQPNLAPGVHGAAVFGWSISALVLAGAAYVLGALLAPVAYRARPGDRRQVDALARAHGSESLSWFAARDDKSHFLLGQDAFIAYRVVRRVAVAVGDPVGVPGRIREAIARFAAMCERNDWIPVFYETCGRWLGEYEAAGLRSMKVGEEAVLPLANFSLSGGRVANLRHGVAKAERESPGIVVQEYHAAARDPAIDEQLEDISAEWLRGKGIGELGFNLGVFSVGELDDKRTMIARTPDGTVWAFVTWLPYRGGRALLLDAMRRRANAPASVIDLLIARSALQFKDEGLEAVSLATAPLANVDEGGGFSAYDRGVKLVFEHFSTVYGYRGLFQFKKKFNPEWESRYLVFPRPDLLPRIAYALVAVHVEGGTVAALRHVLASRIMPSRRRRAR